MTLTLPFLAVSPTAAAAPRITRSNSIPTHDSTFELYSTSQLGSTLSLADKSKGMIRSGSFRDPVDDGESAALLPRRRGLLGRQWGSQHTILPGAMGWFGASHPQHQSRGQQAQDPSVLGRSQP